MKICAVALVVGASAALAQEATAEESRAKAAAEFPDLSNPSSVFAKAYAAEEAQIRASQAGFFSDANWPLMLAYRVAMKLGISGTSEASATSPKPNNSGQALPNISASEAEAASAKHVSPFILTIKGDQGSGSGFVLRRGGKIYLVTNAHVIDGSNEVKVASTDKEFPLPSSLFVSKTRDLILAEVSGFSDGLEAETNFSQVAIGDLTLSLGNSSGAGVARLTTGKVLGIGNDLIETDAGYVQGNSGSPIIHLNSGKVIGVVTYVEKSPNNKLVAESDLKEFRHFAHRVDNLSFNDFRKVNFGQFAESGKLVRKLKQRSEELEAAIKIAQEKLRSGAISRWSLIPRVYEYLGVYEAIFGSLQGFSFNGHGVNDYEVVNPDIAAAGGIFCAVQDIPTEAEIALIDPYNKKVLSEVLTERLALVDELGLQSSSEFRGCSIKVDKNGVPMEGALLRLHVNFRDYLARAVALTSR
jgi:S1-C subfamily serine protease